MDHTDDSSWCDVCCAVTEFREIESAKITGCTLCGYELGRIGGLAAKPRDTRRRSTTHTVARPKPLRCVVCDNSDVTEFIEQDVGNDTKITVCCVCGYQVEQSEGLPVKQNTVIPKADERKHKLQELMKKKLHPHTAVDDRFQSLSILNKKPEHKTPVQVDPLSNRCFCGSHSGFEYFTLPQVLVVYAQCVRCPRRYPYEEWSRFAQVKVTAKVEAKTRIEKLDELFMADHISWHRPLGYHHHAIVVEVDVEENRVKVIHYNGSPTDSGQIEEAWMPADPQNELLYRLDYNYECFTDEDVIAIARNAVGENRYNVLSNNCEHFARFCKIGKKQSTQVKHFQQALLKNVKTLSQVMLTSNGDNRK